MPVGNQNHLPGAVHPPSRVRLQSPLAGKVKREVYMPGDISPAVDPQPRPVLGARAPDAPPRETFEDVVGQEVPRPLAQGRSPASPVECPVAPLERPQLPHLLDGPETFVDIELPRKFPKLGRQEVVWSEFCVANRGPLGMNLEAFEVVQVTRVWWAYDAVEIVRDGGPGYGGAPRC